MTIQVVTKRISTRRSFSRLLKFGLMASSKSCSSSAAAAAALVVGESGNLLQSYQLNDKLCLTVAQGSVVDFASSKHGAIVNAANEGCLGGGGVDGAISNAGGDNLFDDRLKLPQLEGGIRCPTGDAKLTGPGDYGDLKVPYVVHAVGPNYMFFDEENDVETPNRLLRSAYQRSLDCCILDDASASESPAIKHVAFALLSAGVFRGMQSRSDVLAIGIEAIRDWSLDEAKAAAPGNHLEDVIMYAFTDREAQTLVDVCNELLPQSSRLSSPTPEKKAGDEETKPMSIEKEAYGETKSQGKENGEETKSPETKASDETPEAKANDGGNSPETKKQKKDAVETDVCTDSGDSSTEKKE